MGKKDEDTDERLVPLTSVPRGFIKLTRYTEGRGGRVHEFPVNARLIEVIWPWTDYRTVQIGGLNHYVREPYDEIVRRIQEALS